MTDLQCTKDKKDDACWCDSCTSSNPEINHDAAQYWTWDNQQISFSATDIAKMNALFGEMDLTSGEEDDTVIDLSEEDLKWLSKKFGNNW